MNQKIEKFGKSINNVQCISNCYPKNTKMTHPITLENITNIYHNFCAIAETNINGEPQIIDQCNNPIDISHEGDGQSATHNNIDILYPIIDFNAADFLKKYYNINDISDFYVYLRNNKSIPIFTKIRLLECFIIVHGKDISVVEDVFVETIIDIIKKFWIKRMYRKLCNYITVKNDECIFVDPSNNKLSPSDNVSLRTKCIMSVITPQIISEISNNYITNIGMRNKSGIEDFYEFMFTSIENKIKSLL